MFKIPWAFAGEADAADIAAVLVTSDASTSAPDAPVVICCGAAESPFDRLAGISFSPMPAGMPVTYGNDRFTVDGPMVMFHGTGIETVVHGDGGQAVAVIRRLPSITVVRIGYDLLAEVDRLLAVGQPAAHAMSAGIDLQIALLRNLLLACGVVVVEIPPVPAGHRFVACLTHDIDFIGIRHHRFDHSLFGFIARALRSLLTWHPSERWKIWRNLKALASLPAVHLRLAPDFWNPMDRYVPAEAGLPSTYYFVPFAGRPGRNVPADRGPLRAVQYDVTEYADRLKELERGDSEVGVHGIDAWCDAESGRSERQVVRNITGRHDLGVRMHWLYFAEHSPAALEDAGFTYDSTLGFNDAVGYRNGTTQVFRPFGATTLLELPLNAQDTAMLFPARMHLSESAALELCERLIRNAIRFGGVLTINWHDRSLAPERNWNALYSSVLVRLRAGGPWFARARDAVGWFRRRRAVRFDTIDIHDGEVVVRVQGDSWRNENSDGASPPMIVRVHLPAGTTIDAELQAVTTIPLTPRGGESRAC